MKKKILPILLVLTTLFTSRLHSQDLMDLFGEDSTKKVDYAYATFKTTRVVLGQSVESPANGVLQFLISHNFGALNEGAYNLFGLDRSTIRFGLEYGINDWLSAGFGRSSEGKTYDGSLKARILRQSSGARNMPLTLFYYTNLTLKSQKWADAERKNFFSSRLSYIHQLLIARKFSNAVSLQLSPTLVHKNLVETRSEPNDIFAIGAGGRVKLTQRTSVNAEYFYLLNKPNENIHNCLSVGLDIETGGHVFEFRLTNAQPMFERSFIAETMGDWFNGDIYLGFTINRVFTIKKPKSFRE